MTTYYISGPMTGKPNFNNEEFCTAERDLASYLVSFGRDDDRIINPALNFGGAKDLPYETYMTLDLQQVLSADVLVMLGGWEKSHGAVREAKVGSWSGKEFMYAAKSTVTGTYVFSDMPTPDLEDTTTVPTGFVVKDSGQRAEYDSGMVRDTQEGKAMFNLVMPKGVPYEDQMLTRWAMQMTRGADKYGTRNWEKASSDEELERFKGSAQRHLIQWLCGERDEDHAAAVFFNVAAAEFVRERVTA